LLLLSLLAFPWEVPEDLLDLDHLEVSKDLLERAFNSIGDGAALGGTCLLLEQLGDNNIRQASEDSLNAILTSGGTTLLLKQLIHSKRPTGNSYDSFPSGHATVAFASARVFSHYYPEKKWIYYLLATGVAVARVQSKAHHTRDVIAGAIVGYWGGDLALEGKGILPILKKKF